MNFTPPNLPALIREIEELKHKPYRLPVTGDKNCYSFKKKDNPNEKLICAINLYASTYAYLLL